MNKNVIVFFTIVATAIALSSAAPANGDNGKYNVSGRNDGKYHPIDDGKYRPRSNDEDRKGGYIDAHGRYQHTPVPYVHVSDNRELGKYVHIPNPYDGGYGPYSGSNIPYNHDARPYVHDDKPYDHNLYTVSNADFKVPEIQLEYGFPDHEPIIEETTTLSNQYD